MEYCGAGSVSDIMKLRNKTVRFINNKSACRLFQCRDVCVHCNINEIE